MCLHRHRDRKNFTEARDACFEEGGTLFEPRTAPRMYFYQQYSKNADVLVFIYFGNYEIFNVEVCEERKNKYGAKYENAGDRGPFVKRGGGFVDSPLPDNTQNCDLLVPANTFLLTFGFYHR